MLLFVDQLCNVDFSYLCAKRGLVGETWLANIELEGELDEQGMVCDFGEVKSLMRRWLDDTLDHTLLIPGASEHLSLAQNKDTDAFTWKSAVGEISGEAPKQAHCILDGVAEVNAESAAQWCIKQLKKHFPDSVSSLRLSFTTENISGPYYHYSHGLKKHGGNCQRIAHGHRSKIEIWKNGKLDQELMSRQAKQWEDIYIGTHADLREPDDTSSYNFEYKAQQGEFRLSVPKSSCYLIDTDSTVEFIAKHILDKLIAEDSAASYRVKAYEGISKGAIAEATHQ